MGWRFRKSFTVIPGVRLNVGKHGISTTIGGSPLSFNVGPRGVHATATLPGTGLSYRQRLSGEAAPHDTLPSGHTPALRQIPETHEIRSGSTESMTTEGLAELKKLLLHTGTQRAEIEGEIKTQEWTASNARSRYDSWASGFLLKRVFRGAFLERGAISETETAKLSELQEQLRLTSIATDINIDGEQAEAYFSLVDAFSALCNSKSIWDVLAERAVNRPVERSAASTSVKREMVRFSLSSSDVIDWRKPVPRMENKQGGDLFIYPGMILYRVSREAFSLLDFEQVSIAFEPVKFIESEKIPEDAKVVGAEWYRANKDGGPDRRFVDNYQMPVALYGQLAIKSDTGLNELFHFSNSDLAAQFALAWRRCHIALYGEAAHQELQISESDLISKDKISMTGNVEEIDGIWHGTCAAYPEVNVTGDTREQTIEKLKTAVTVAIAQRIAAAKPRRSRTRKELSS